MQEIVLVEPGVKLVLDGHETETADGEETLMLTVPEKLKRLVKVTVPVAEDPVLNETLDADML